MDSRHDGRSNCCGSWQFTDGPQIKKGFNGKKHKETLINGYHDTEFGAANIQLV